MMAYEYKICKQKEIKIFVDFHLPMVYKEKIFI